jgi:geranylgeranylglycerol-phosphate geranylgeranyltransferase
MASFSALLGMLVVLGPDLWDADLVIPIALGMVVPFLVTMGGNALNDYMDRDLDRGAHPGRPIPSGRLSPHQVLWVAMGAFIVAQPLAGAIATLGPSGLFPLLVELLAIGSLFGYELSLKARGLAGNITVSYLSALTLVFGASCVAGYDHEGIPTVLLLFAMALMASLGREITKDIEDIQGDAGERLTFPMRVGIARATRMAIGSILVAVFLSIIPFILNRLDVLPYLAVVMVANVLFIYSCVFVSVEPAKAQTLQKAGMFVALLAFLVGSLQGGIL